MKDSKTMATQTDRLNLGSNSSDPKKRTHKLPKETLIDETLYRFIILDTVQFMPSMVWTKLKRNYNHPQPGFFIVSKSEK